MTRPAGDDGFDAIVAGDLAARRQALDELDEWTLVADRAGVLLLHPDGRVEARVVLAGPDGPTSHPRTLSAAAIDRLAADQPPRWARPQCVYSPRPECAGPAARLLASWAPTDTMRHDEGNVPWSTLLVSKSSPR